MSHRRRYAATSTGRGGTVRIEEDAGGDDMEILVLALIALAVVLLPGATLGADRGAWRLRADPLLPRAT